MRLRKNAVIYAAILISTLSCSKKEEVDLSLSLVGTNAYLIDADAQTCSNAIDVYQDPENNEVTYSLSSQYFSIREATLNWKNTENTAYVAYLRVTSDSPSITVSCTISGDELAAVFYDFQNKLHWDGVLAPAPSANLPTKLASSCPIRCGGATVRDITKYTSVPGTVTLVGFERTPGGEEKPLKATADITLTFQP